MSGTFYFATTMDEVRALEENEEALHLQDASETGAVMSHVTHGGTAVALIEQFCTGFRLPSGTDLMFTDSCPEDGPLRAQAEARRHPMDMPGVSILGDLDRWVDYSALKYLDPDAEAQKSPEASSESYDPSSLEVLKDMEPAAKRDTRNIIDTVGVPLYPHQQELIDKIRATAEQDPEALTKVRAFASFGKGMDFDEDPEADGTPDLRIQRLRGVATGTLAADPAMAAIRDRAAAEVLKDRPEIAETLGLANRGSDDAGLASTLLSRSQTLAVGPRGDISWALNLKSAEIAEAEGMKLPEGQSSLDIMQMRGRTHRPGHAAPEVRVLHVGVDRLNMLREIHDAAAREIFAERPEVPEALNFQEDRSPGIAMMSCHRVLPAEVAKSVLQDFTDKVRALGAAAGVPDPIGEADRVRNPFEDAPEAAQDPDDPAPDK